MQEDYWATHPQHDTQGFVFILAEERCKFSKVELIPPTVQVPSSRALVGVGVARASPRWGASGFGGLPGFPMSEGQAANSVLLPGAATGVARHRHWQRRIRARDGLRGAAGDSDALPAREGPARRQ